MAWWKCLDTPAARDRAFFNSMNFAVGAGLHQITVQYEGERDGVEGYAETSTRQPVGPGARRACRAGGGPVRSQRRSVAARPFVREMGVEEVVAHLTAAASLNRWKWLRSMLSARFRPDVHNQRRLVEHRGTTAAETLDQFRAVINSTTAPSAHIPAYLGEVRCACSRHSSPSGAGADTERRRADTCC
jgi:hypothetical protein